MENIDKIIVSNRGALVHKHGAAGFKKIQRALAALIKADAKRGLKTAVVFLDMAADMKTIGAPLAKPADRKQTKRAIDEVCRTLQPDYLMILGAPDVVAHQLLVNPIAAARDPDRHVESDLPYACDRPYDVEIRRFLGPTRVVGRLPDVAKHGDTALLVKLLAHASSWRSRARADYEKHFALSAQSWKSSTRTSIRKLFGSQNGVHLSPDDGPAWANGDLEGRIHFINCHGDSGQPEFYGENEHDDDDMPIAHESARLPGLIQPGTVVAAECCYGAELYAPKAGKPLPIGTAYLAEGAFGFLGSTTVAWGPAEGTNFADYMCLRFVRAVLDGASIGRAALLSQQEYVAQGGYMEMIDLKTIAQFVLLGDPSIHPVIGDAKSKTKLKSPSRKRRRKRMAKQGAKLALTTASVRSEPDAKAKPSPALAAELRDLGATGAKVVSFKLHAPTLAVHAAEGRRLTAHNTVFHAVVPPETRARRAAPPRKIFMVREVSGKIERVATAIRHS